MPQLRHQFASSSITKLTILLIEDAETDRVAYRRYLQADYGTNYQILEAETRQAGEHLWRTHWPDLVLLDLALPDGDGLDLLAKIAPTYQGAKVPVIILTGHGDEEALRTAVGLGALDFLEKEHMSARSLQFCVKQGISRIAADRQLVRSQRQSQLITEMALRIRQSLDLTTILNATVQEVRTFLKADRVVVYQFDPQDMSGTIAAEAVVPPWRPSLHEQVEDTCFQSTRGEDYRRGRVSSIDDIDQADLSPCHRQLLQQFQVRANLVVPIVLPTSTESLWGLLVAHQCDAPRHWETADVQLLEQFAVQVAIAIQQAELYGKLQTANATLEAQVRSRTTELKESRNRFRGIFDGMFQFTGLCSPDGTLLEANQTALSAGGVCRDEVVGKPFWEARWWTISSETQSQLREAIARAAQGEFIRYEVDVLMAENIVIPIDFSLRPVTDEAGQVVLLIPEGRDLSEAKRLQAEREETFRQLQASERRYATLAAAAPVGIFRMDATGDCSYVNDRYCAITGLTAEQVSGQQWRQWIYEEDRDYAFGEWERCVQTGELYQVECRFRRPDGGLRWVYVQIAPYTDSADQVIDYVGTMTDISDRKNAETALQESEARNRAILRVMPDLMVRVGADGRYRGLVTERSDLDLIPADIDPMGLSLSDTLPPEIAEQKSHYLQRALETGEIQVYEQQITHSDREQYEEVRAIRSGEDEVLFIIRDISDRRRAEAEKLEMVQVRKELQLVENVLDVILAGYWDWHIAEDTCYYSPGWKRILGYEDHELPNRTDTWQTLIFSEDLPMVLQQMAQHFQSRGAFPLNMEERYRHKDGSTVWVLCSGKVIEWDDAGQPVRMIGCHLNITDRKQAEAQIVRQLAAIESASDGIGILQNDRFIYLNQAHLELFGFQRAEELLGDTWRQLYTPQQAAEFEKTIFPILQRDRRWRGEAVGYRRDGTYFPQELSLTLTDDNLLICVCRDISDRKAAEAELRRTNQELERATRLKDEFLANMSHELRTPLNAILGMNEGLQEQIFGLLNERQLDMLKTMEQSGTHLLSLINDILDLAKIESGHMDIYLSSVDAVSLCQSSLMFVKQQAFKKSIQLKLNLPPQVPQLEADERRIRQVLINLLSNAVKFTPDGGTVTLSIGDSPLSDPEQGSHFLRLTVSDTGIGIAAEDLPKLFRPFVQIDGSLTRKYEGTGLGLALVKRTVDLHGGQVDVISEVGVGSTFMVDLPCAKSCPIAATSPDLRQHQASSDSSDAADAAAPVILLVEDNLANLTTTQNYLTARGYRLCVARNGEEAIHTATAESPALILMDVQMPDMDGLEAIKTIRQMPALADTPIIALTALAMDRDRERCLTAGANDYFSKPVRMKHLVSRIEALLAPDRQFG